MLEEQRALTDCSDIKGHSEVIPHMACKQLAGDPLWFCVRPHPTQSQVTQASQEIHGLTHTTATSKVTKTSRDLWPRGKRQGWDNRAHRPQTQETRGRLETRPPARQWCRLQNYRASKSAKAAERNPGAGTCLGVPITDPRGPGGASFPAAQPRGSPAGLHPLRPSTPVHTW